MSFSFVACNSQIAEVLAKLSNSNFMIRTFKEEDHDRLGSSPSKNIPPPPLILEIPDNGGSKNQSSSLLLFPACAAIRTHDENPNNCDSDDNSSKTKKTVKRLQILIPNLHQMEISSSSSSSSSCDDTDDDENGNEVENEASTDETNAFSTFDDIPHKIVGDDGGRCIIVASSVNELTDFVLKGDSTSRQQNNMDCEEYYWIPVPPPISSQEQQIGENVLLSPEDIKHLAKITTKNASSSSGFVGQDGSEVGVDDDGTNDFQERRRIIRRVNGEIVDAAANVMSTLSLTRLALIYDDVESRREKIMRTRSTGNKDVKTVVVPVIDGEEQKLVKFGFIS